LSDNAVEILLVEDNPRDLKLALHAFSEHQLAHRIQIARDGAEALEFLFGTGAFAGLGVPRRLRIVLLDLKLPRVDGHEVLQRIRDDPRTQTLPVVVLTSSRDALDIERCYRLGANSYIVKPVDFDRFREVSRQVGIYWLTINQPVRD
jgi:two-component system response regulator